MAERARSEVHASSEPWERAREQLDLARLADLDVSTTPAAPREDMGGADGTGDGDGVC